MIDGQPSHWLSEATAPTSRIRTAPYTPAPAPSDTPATRCELEPCPARSPDRLPTAWRRTHPSKPSPQHPAPPGACSAQPRPLPTPPDSPSPSPGGPASLERQSLHRLHIAPNLQYDRSSLPPSHCAGWV